MLSSSSSHSRDSSTLTSSFSARSKSNRRVAFDSVDFVEFAVEWEEDDEPYYSGSGPWTVQQTSEEGKAERCAFLASNEYEIQGYRWSSPDLSSWRQERMKRLQSSLRIPIVHSPLSSSGKNNAEWSQVEDRIQEAHQRVDSLLERMEILDQNMARRGRRRQQRQRARRAALVLTRTGSSSSLDSFW